MRNEGALYLSSYRIGDHADRLLQMAGGHGAPMAVISNALDYIPDEDRRRHARVSFDPHAYFTDYGFAPSPLDLRHYFGRPDALYEILRQYKIVWAVGGNSFLLRRAMRHSGFDYVIGCLLNDAIVYGGWSAGACVAGNSLEAIAQMDEPDRLASGYPSSAPVREGMDLVPFTIIPHHDSDHPETEGAARSIGWAKQRAIPYRALRDGEVIVVENGVMEILGRRSEGAPAFG